MTTHPGLTVVILTYNSAGTLANCLEGLAQQKDADFDVLIVDDDSTDSTRSVADRYAGPLRMRTIRNGTHSIPHGRNLGLAEAGTDLVAFVDSDDRPAADWTHVIRTTFAENPSAALVSGRQEASYRTATARAIALNDAAVRQLIGQGAVAFAAGNSAVNRAVWPGARFDERFPYAEDLELVTRATREYQWVSNPDLVVHYFSRGSLTEYARQMYQYGRLKQLYAWSFRRHRPVDSVPSVLLVGSAVAAVRLRRWWPLASIVVFSMAEAGFVVARGRHSPRLLGLSFGAWLVKNLAWGSGIGRAFVAYAVDPQTRELVRAKRFEGKDYR